MSDQPEESTGPLGDGGVHPGKGNMRLLRRAIKERWPITPEMRGSVVRQMADVVDTSKVDRDRIAASKVLLGADKLNLAEESLDLQHERGPQQAAGPRVQVNVSIDGRRARAIEILDSLGERERIAGAGNDPVDERRPDDANGETNGFSHT